MATVITDNISQLATEFNSRTAEELLEFAFAEYGNDAALACSFSGGGVVLVDMAARIYPRARVFYVDTDFLFPETYETRNRVAARYPSLRIEAVRTSMSPAEQAARVGPELWKVNPDECCNIRKVTPLTRYLSSLEAWISGIRHDQAPTRANAKKIEWDSKFGLVKFNPLVDWSWDQVWDYIRQHDVPYNPLHDRNYLSIGCTHCTRQVLPGEDPRAGRWSGFQKTECGLHK